MLEKDMALLLLLWQEACLEHQKENDTLMPGAKSATLEEEKKSLENLLHTGNIELARKAIQNGVKRKWI